MNITFGNKIVFTYYYSWDGIVIECSGIVVGMRGYSNNMTYLVITDDHPRPWSLNRNYVEGYVTPTDEIQNINLLYDKKCWWVDQSYIVEVDPEIYEIC